MTMTTTMIISVFTQINFVADFLQAKCNFRWMPFCVFEAPFRGFSGNVRCLSSTDWKARSWISVSVNWTLFRSVLRLRRTSQYRLKIGVFAPTGSVWLKMSGRKDCLYQLFFFQKTRMNDLSCGIRIWVQVSFILSQSMRLSERPTDRQMESFLTARTRCIGLHCWRRGKNYSIWWCYGLNN